MNKTPNERGVLRWKRTPYERSNPSVDKIPNERVIFAGKETLYGRELSVVIRRKPKRAFLLCTVYVRTGGTAVLSLFRAGGLSRCINLPAVMSQQTAVPIRINGSADRCRETDIGF
jgi:hypothetical protein